MAAAISLEGVVKRFGTRTALAGVSFEVGAGEVVALLGPNGAGKSTTLSILATLLRPDAGQVRVAGAELPRQARLARQRVGLVPQREALYPSLSARENLTFFARMQGLGAVAAGRAAAELLARVGLEGRAEEPIERFSGGMRRRLNLACGIVHRPSVLLLDEPTAGVDPQSREHIFELLGELAAAGAAVLHSTHVMEEAERLCDRAVLLDDGRLVAAGTIEELVARAPVREETRVHRADLADVFFHLTGRGLRDANAP
jgi:linearmycin/streptolysin S transport system ATP-binding protein